MTAKRAGDVSESAVSLGDVHRFDPAPAALSPRDLSRLIGVQANVWTRPDENEADVELMTFPRAAALAETGWTRSSQLSWAGFQPRLVTMMARYSRLGVRYSDAAFRPMVYKRGEAGDRISIELAKQVPLGEIRYTVNGTEPTARSSVYIDVFEVPRGTVVKAAVFYNGEAVSRTTSFNVSMDLAGGPL
jgi:hexosaminidase